MVAFANDYKGQTRNIEQMAQVLEAMSCAGFTHVHWSYEWDTPYLYSIHEMRQIKDLLDTCHLKAKGVHAAEGIYEGDPGKFRYACTQDSRKHFASQNEYNRLAGVELIENRVDLAAMLGAEEIVLHMQVPYQTFLDDPAFKKQYFKQVFRSFDALEPYCKAKGVRICLENVLGAPAKHICHYLDTLFNRYDAEFLGFCLDTGHANVTCGDDPLLLPRRYQARLFAVHLNDNMGLLSPACWTDGKQMEHCDKHLLPLQGTYDWDGFLPLLAESPYALPVLLETAFPGGDEVEYLQQACEIGQQITNRLLQLRSHKTF